MRACLARLEVLDYFERAHGLREQFEFHPPRSRYPSRPADSPVLIGDRISGLRRMHAQLPADAQAEGSRLRCSLPHVQRTSNTGTNVIP